MALSKRQRDGKLRLKGCPPECPCLCHDTGGGVMELHPDGYCIGKRATNPPELLARYVAERNAK